MDNVNNPFLLLLSQFTTNYYGTIWLLVRKSKLEMGRRGGRERESHKVIERGGNIRHLFTIMYTVPNKEEVNSLYNVILCLPIYYTLSLFKASVISIGIHSSVTGIVYKYGRAV